MKLAGARDADRLAAARDEVQMAVSLATGFLEERFSSTAEHMRAA